MWHLPTKRMLGAVTVPAAPVHAVAFAPSGRMFAVGCASGALVLFAMTPDAIANALTLASQQQQQQQQSQSQSQSAQSQSAASQSASASSPSSSAHAAASAAAAAAAVADAETDPSIIGAFGVFAPASVVIREHIADVRAVCFSTEVRKMGG